MSRLVTGTLLGVVVSAFCSLLGVVLARSMGGDVVMSATLVHAAATVVLLVNILLRVQVRE